MWVCTGASLFQLEKTVPCNIIAMMFSRLRTALAAALLLLLSGRLCFAQGVILNEGESFLFEFSSLDYIRPVTIQDSHLFRAFFAPGSYTSGETITVELFANSLGDDPLRFYGISYADPADNLAVNFEWAWSPAAQPIWPDLQGLARVTVTGGQIELSGFQIDQLVGGGFYSLNTPVPEPSVFALGALAGLVAIVFKRRGRFIR